MMIEPMTQPVLKIALTEVDRQAAINQLKENDLPTSDLDEDKLLYLLMDGDRILGTAGLEIFGDCALLRSVSITRAAQGKGYGRFMVEGMEKFASDSGIGCLYLLTTTAKDFFEHQGYCLILRDESPEAIKQTAEFTTLCSSTAIVMKKKL